MRPYRLTSAVVAGFAGLLVAVGPPATAGAGASGRPEGARAVVLQSVQASSGPLPASETAVAVDPADPSHVLAGANDKACSLGGFEGLGLYSSMDGGVTWSHSCMKQFGNEIDANDPSLAYGPHGTAYAAGLEGSQAIFATSVDQGVTWSDPQRAVPPFFDGGAPDVPGIVVDRSPSSPHAGTIYVSATQYSPDFHQAISVSRSTDGGQTWTESLASAVRPPTEDNNWSHLAIARDGTVYVSWQRCLNASVTCAGHRVQVLLSVSRDGGVSWHGPRIVGVVTAAPDTCGGCAYYGNLPNTQFDAGTVMGIAVDTSGGPRDGELYAVMQNWTGTFLQVQVASSKSGGNTWSSPVPVGPPTATHDQFFPWLSVGENGLVGVSWLDRRNDPANTKYQPFAAVSSDGGASFSTNVELTKVLSDPAADFGDWFGDYTGNAWGGTAFHVVWPDTRTGASEAEAGGIDVEEGR